MEDGACQSGQLAGDLGDGCARVGGQGNEGLLGRLVLGLEGADGFHVAVLLGDKGLFHGLARVCLNVVAIDVDGVSWRDLAERDQAPPQGGLEVQAALDGNVLKEPVRGGWRREKRKASKEAEVSAADGIDGANASCIAENRLKDEPQGEALLRQSFRLERA
ncbi:MAG: hypothetical protein V3T85_13240 [Acidiferrobacterales bacterium]